MSASPLSMRLGTSGGVVTNDMWLLLAEAVSPGDGPRSGWLSVHLRVCTDGSLEWVLYSLYGILYTR